MAKHDDMLEQGPRDAPEPETAEQRSKRVGLGGAAGGIVAGGAAAAKLGVLTKVLVWYFAWHGAVSAWRIGGWIGLAVVLAAIALFVVLRARSES
jgi:hypothetical protein